MAQIPQLIWRVDETPEELHPLLGVLEEEYPVFSSGRGLKLKFRRIDAEGTISRVSRTPGEVLVEYNSISAAARGIGSALAKLDGEETTPFKTLGIMLDVSRNMVMTPDHLKMWFRRMALSGYNMIMLYTEDVYELEGESFFGYMRGAYTLDEIQELDRYAAKLGIEMIGCIQTLGHLEQIIRWDGAYGSITDTNRVLLTDEPGTYALIEKMIRFWSEALGSRRIHIGMDETHDLGRGKFLDRFGYESGFELFNRHLARVNEICKANGLKPMIWSDMYFRLSNPEMNYYDLSNPVPADVRAKIPKDVELVYWDYYTTNTDFYKKMIQTHRDIGYDPLMGSGIWTWARLWYDHALTRRTVTPCIEACREMQTREIFFTMWGDDGAYCNYDSSLAGILFAGDLAFGVSADDETRTAKRFEAVCGSSYEAQLTAAALNIELPYPEKENEIHVINASQLIWDDPLLGIYTDNHLRINPEFDFLVIDRYEELLAKLLPYAEDRAAGDLGHAVNILDLVIKKLELRNALVAAYQMDDRIALRQIAATLIPAVIAAVREFDASFRAQWLSCAKPFGLDTIQIRNAGQIARLEETARRIREYIAGETARIEELEQRPAYDAPVNTLCWYRHVATGSMIY